MQKVFFKNSQNSQENASVGVEAPSYWAASLLRKGLRHRSFLGDL